MKSKPILGLTMGDPAGIGPEICLRALGEPSVLSECVPVLFGDVAVLHRLEQNGFPGNDARVVPLEEFKACAAIDCPVVVDCNGLNREDFKPGCVSAACGKAAHVYIEQAIRAALAKRIDGVVTAPIHKEALRLAGVEHPGHTEIFTALTGAKRSCMMLYSDKLTVSMVTTHIGFHEVPGKLSVERVLAVLNLPLKPWDGSCTAHRGSVCAD